MSTCTIWLCTYQRIFILRICARSVISLVHKVTQAFAVPCGAVWRNIMNTIDGLPQWTASICGPSAMSRLDFYSCGACVAVDQSDLLILQPRGAVQRLDTQRIARDGRRGIDYRRRENSRASGSVAARRTRTTLPKRTHGRR